MAAGVKRQSPARTGENFVRETAGRLTEIFFRDYGTFPEPPLVSKRTILMPESGGVGGTCVCGTAVL